MIRKLAKLKYWEIAVTGICGAVTALLIFSGGLRLLVDTWPQTHEAAHIAYLVGSAVLAWVIVGIFMEAALTKYRESRIDGALDALAEALGKALSADEKKESGRHV